MEMKFQSRLNTFLKGQLGRRRQRRESEGRGWSGLQGRVGGWRGLQGRVGGWRGLQGWVGGWRRMVGVGRRLKWVTGVGGRLEVGGGEYSPFSRSPSLFPSVSDSAPLPQLHGMKELSSLSSLPHWEWGSDTPKVPP